MMAMSRLYMTIDEIFAEIEEDSRRVQRFILRVTVVEVIVCTILAVVTR